MPDEKVDELTQIAVYELAFRIAPLAVVLVKRAVRLTAQKSIFKRHAAALADELYGRAEKGIYGYVEKPRKRL